MLYIIAPLVILQVCLVSDRESQGLGCISQTLAIALGGNTCQLDLLLAGLLICKQCCDYNFLCPAQARPDWNYSLLVKIISGGNSSVNTLLCIIQ